MLWQPVRSLNLRLKRVLFLWQGFSFSISIRSVLLNIWRQSANAPAATAVLGNPAEISPAVHELLREELKRYFFIGGMPAAVKAYLENKLIA